MRKAMLRDLAAHKQRLVMTLVAITLGVAAVVASWIAGDSIPHSIVDAEANTGVDVSVRGELDPASATRLAKLPGVDAATTVTRLRAGFIGGDGKLVDTLSPFDVAGTGWDDSGRFRVDSGRAPKSADEIAIGEADAERTGLEPGDAAKLLLADGERASVTVTGVFAYRTLGPAADDPTPAIAFGDTSGLDTVIQRVDLTTGDPAAVAAAAPRLVGGDAEVHDGTDLAEAAREEAAGTVSDLRMLLLPFGCLALLVGMFIIANTFAMLVAQRTRMLALLRAVGARRAQVRRTVLLEALVLSMVGGTSGVLAGIALGPAILALMSDTELNYVVSWVGIAIGYVSAAVVTVLAALGAARRAASVPPLAALRADATPPATGRDDRCATTAATRRLGRRATPAATGQPGFSATLVATGQPDGHAAMESDATATPGQADRHATAQPAATGIPGQAALHATTAASRLRDGREPGSRAASRPHSYVTAAWARVRQRPRDLVAVAGLLLAVGVIAATATPTAGTPQRIAALSSAALVAVSMLLLAPTLLTRALRIVARTRLGRGPATRLAIQQALAEPRRASGTAVAITIGMILVCAFATLNATLSDLIASTLRSTVPASTTVVEPAGGGDASLTRDEVEQVASTPGVTASAASADVIATIEYDGGSAPRKVSAIDADALTTVLTPEVTEGSADLRDGFVIARNQADTLGIAVGDTVTVRLDDGQTVTSPVAGVYEATEYSASVYVDARLVPPQLRQDVKVVYASGSGARAALDRAFADRPDVRVTDVEGLVAEVLGQQRFAFVIFYAMFALSLVIALFGVVNTLTLSVLERAREIGVLRAIGAPGRLVRRMVRAESVIIAVFGAGLGILVGLGVGAVMQQSMLGQPLWNVTVPWQALALALPGAVVTAVVAAVWPSRRATRADVLTSIATD